MTPSTEQASSPSTHILLVDDQPANLLALQALLEPLGQDLVTAPSGEDALRRLLEQDFAVVLLDVQMQGIDGFETAKLIRGRERSRHTPIIFLTAYESDNFPIARAYTLGAVDYLVKPIVPEILRAKVAVFVDLYRQTQRAARLAREQAARTEASRAAERSAFLARAGAELAGSLDYETTLQNVARLAVPRLADWCVVDVVADGGAIRQVAVTHADPAKVQLAWELDHRYPDQPDAPEGVPKVLRTGRAELFSEITDDLLRAVARDDEHLTILRGLGLRSGMIVPLSARGRVLGAVSLGTAESGRAYGPDDLTLAEELAHRAALAVDNARLYGEVQEADRSKDRFLAMLAHELRNPLAPVVTGLYVLRQTSDPAPRERTLEMMERQLRHLARLVDDLLDVSRITQGKIHLRRERLDLGQVARTTAEDRRPTLEQAGLRLSLDTPQTPVWVQGDSTRLAQVLGNLLDNAAKFSEADGTVTVRVAAEPAAGQALLAVRDDGAGIEPELLPRLFDVFAQGDRTLERTRGGLGLGLAVVKGLIELHGGEVSAYSAGPGKGAEFTVRLPLEAEPSALAGPATPAGPAPERLRVLIVEDNRDAAESLRLLLELLGHEVTCANTGLEGVSKAAAWRPEVVLCDIGLPGLDGYGVARALRRNPATAETRLIAVTGYGQESDRRQALAAGFDHHLTKPVEPEALELLLTRRE